MHFCFNSGVGDSITIVSGSQGVGIISVHVLVAGSLLVASTLNNNKTNILPGIWMAAMGFMDYTLNVTID